MSFITMLYLHNNNYNDGLQYYKIVHRTINSNAALQKKFSYFNQTGGYLQFNNMPFHTILQY